MKKILYLHAGAELYGADIVLLELLKRLDKKKFYPYVVLPCYGPLVDKLKENNIEVEVLEYPILRRKYFNPSGIINYAKNYIKYSKILKKICNEKKIDIVHTNTAAVLSGVYLKKKLEIKHIWHIQLRHFHPYQYLILLYQHLNQASHMEYYIVKLLIYQLQTP